MTWPTTFRRNLPLIFLFWIAIPILLSGCGTGCPPVCLGERLGSVDWSGKNLKGARLTGADLRQANLSGVDFTGADLSGVGLSNANLKSVNFTDAKLIGSNLENAYLSGSILKGADLSGSSLISADLTGVVLSSARLNSVDFTSARLTNADLSQLDLSAAYFDYAKMAGAILNRVEFDGGLMDYVDLSGADLRYADFSGSWINLSTLVSANMEEANLSGASLIGTDMTGANLYAASLAGANLIGTIMRGADLRGADLSEAILIATPELLDKEKQNDVKLKKLSESQWEKLQLGDTILDGIKYNDRTIWPKDFQIPESAIYQPGYGGDELYHSPTDFIRIIIGGSTAVYDLVKPLSMGFMHEYPNVFIKFIQTDSTEGITAAGNGTVNFGMASRQLTPAEKVKYKFLNEVLIGNDRIAIVTNVDNHLNGLSMEDVRAVFSGKIANWKEIGGDDIPIQLVIPQTTLAEFFSNVVMKSELVNQETLLSVPSNPAVLATVAQNRGAIGVVPGQNTDGSIKVMMLDGFLPSPDSPNVQQYPIYRPLYLLYHNESSGLVKPMLDFIFSDTGKQIMIEEEFEPANR